jgi:hypothetical protein
LFANKQKTNKARGNAQNPNQRQTTEAQTRIAKKAAFCSTSPPMTTNTTAAVATKVIVIRMVLATTCQAPLVAPGKWYSHISQTVASKKKRSNLTH